MVPGAGNLDTGGTMSKWSRSRIEDDLQQAIERASNLEVALEGLQQDVENDMAYSKDMVWDEGQKHLFGLCLKWLKIRAAKALEGK
jgi:hypothetical protein